MFAQNLTKDTLGAGESNPRDYIRVYTIRKEKQSYTVVVKPIKTNQKTFYLRGYLTQRCAERDLPRLLIHLRTKRVQTFEQNTGEEYDITPPSKKRKDETLHVVSTVKELRGNCFKQLCHRLEYSYYRYRTEAKSKDSSCLSKTRWMKQQSLKNADDKCKFEQRRQNDSAVKLESSVKFVERVRVLCKDKNILPLERIWKFERRARDYTRLYLALGQRAGRTTLTHAEIENMRSKQKTHRNIMKIDREFVQNE